MTAQSHTEFVDGFYRISQDHANKIVSLRAAGEIAGCPKHCEPGSVAMVNCSHAFQEKKNETKETQVEGRYCQTGEEGA